MTCKGLAGIHQRSLQTVSRHNASGDVRKHHPPISRRKSPKYANESIRHIESPSEMVGSAKSRNERLIGQNGSTTTDADVPRLLGVPNIHAFSQGSRHLTIRRGVSPVGTVALAADKADPEGGSQFQAGSR